LVSGLVETAQLGIPGRMAGARDVGFNVLGVLIGWLLARSAPMLLRPRPRTADRLALAAAVAAGGLMAATGLLLRPALPRTEYFGGLAHSFGHLQTYRGRILAASVGDREIRSGRNPDSAGIRDRLLRGDLLRVSAVAGPPVTALAPLLTIHDLYLREILLVGVEGDDLVYRFRTWAAALGLDNPELRLGGAVGAVRPGDALTITVAPRRIGHCIQVNADTTCGVGFTLGQGWALFLHAQRPPLWLQPALGALWMASLVVLSGYWARSGLGLGVVAAVLVVSLLLLPGQTGLVATPLSEIGAAVIGFAGAISVRRWLG
jgi:hypothetical protein